MTTLLVVDDNAAVRATLAAWFTRRGYTVLLARDGADALDHFAHAQVDAVMVDVRLSNMDGAEVCRALRAQAQAEGRDLPVWLMTGARTPEPEKFAATAGGRCRDRQAV
jgi:chemosensory pili system protein ChpA (sensor histidine kinase/response regulator)